ncbi:recombinase RecT [Colwellia sp. 6_MG-2023]|jgi:recombinational DNA repair protein RecT|uniref:recombinase RecT n=1 Tax=Colwellia sp. 6_MG-2023 TaxID=3062676 RepID=UPI0026E3B10A|nr:recombinase RecT [Colwellia sp. 6_MG-2023]MDO6488056.1 recombinase RecT [Colwellia sp. 6_MG-2023]
MNHLSANTKRLIDLYNDTELKALFTKNYLASGVHLAKIDQEFAWAFGTITRSELTETAPALSSLSSPSIKRLLLAISESGLSFDPQQKHFYLSTEISLGGTLVPKVVLGYLGMKQVAMRSGLVRGISNDVIYERDSFTWYGANKEPAFASSTRDPGENVAGGYVCLHMKDGTIHSYRMSSEELLSIEASDIQMRMDIGGVESSLYSGPWRERCLRIALWRCAFREFQHIFIDTDNLLEQHDENKEDNSVTPDFSDKFAAALNNSNQAATA